MHWLWWHNNWILYVLLIIIMMTCMQILKRFIIQSVIWNQKQSSSYKNLWIHIVPLVLKPNQKLKYLNKGSTHTNSTANAIPSGIFYRLVKLTSRTKKNAKMKIYERYLWHAKALSKAGLAPKIFLTLKWIWNKTDASKINNAAKRGK